MDSGNFILPEMQILKRFCISRLGISDVLGKFKPAQRTKDFRELRLRVSVHII